MSKILHDGTEVSNDTPTKLVDGLRYALTTDEIEGRRSEEIKNISGAVPAEVEKYRDLYIEQEVTYSNGETVFRVTNTEQNRNRLSALYMRWKVGDPVSVPTIDFTHNGGIDKATREDLEGIIRACFIREQAGRSAAAHTLKNHNLSPHTDDSWKEEFDIFTTTK